MERLKIKIPSLLNKYPNANPEILEFINSMQNFYKTTQTFDAFVEFFTKKYCYYFAIMLQDAFGGKLMIDMKYYHVVTVINGIPYDVNGIYEKNSVANLIPIENLREAAELYKHRGHDMDIDHEINAFCTKYSVTLDELYKKIYDKIPKEKRLSEFPGYEDASIWWNTYKNDIEKELM